MPNLTHVRAEILDNLLAKYLAGDISWSARAGENSFETTIGDYAFHIDRKSSGTKIVYRVWVFDPSGEDVDNFDSAGLTEYTPEDTNFPDYYKVAQFIYRDIKEKETVAKLTPALEKLKSAGS